MILVYIPCKDNEEAKNIAKALLEKKFIACANILPIESVYRWNDEIQNDSETVLILKTEENKWDQVKEEVTKLHSYDVPCILKIPTAANDAFAHWVSEQVS